MGGKQKTNTGIEECWTDGKASTRPRPIIPGGHFKVLSSLPD